MPAGGQEVRPGNAASRARATDRSCSGCCPCTRSPPPAAVPPAGSMSSCVVPSSAHPYLGNEPQACPRRSPVSSGPRRRGACHARPASGFLQSPAPVFESWRPRPGNRPASTAWRSARQAALHRRWRGITPVGRRSRRDTGTPAPGPGRQRFHLSRAQRCPDEAGHLDGYAARFCHRLPPPAGWPPDADPGAGAHDPAGMHAGRYC